MKEADPAPSRLDPEEETGLFQTWIRQGGSGCLFAQNRANGNGDASYSSLVLETDSVPSVVALDELQDQLIAAQSCDAALVHLSSPTTVDSLAQVLVAIGRSEHWYLQTMQAPDDPDHVLVLLRWPVPRTFVASEVLGFADLDCLPPTRRAPTTTLMLRTAPPPESDPTVHLAQMPYLPHEDEHIDFYWQGTRRARAALTPRRFHASAQAPVTFRLPVAAWRLARQSTRS